MKLLRNVVRIENILIDLDQVVAVDDIEESKIGYGHFTSHLEFRIFTQGHMGKDPLVFFREDGDRTTDDTAPGNKEKRMSLIRAELENLRNEFLAQWSILCG